MHNWRVARHRFFKLLHRDIRRAAGAGAGSSHVLRTSAAMVCTSAATAPSLPASLLGSGGARVRRTTHDAHSTEHTWRSRFARPAVGTSRCRRIRTDTAGQHAHAGFERFFVPVVGLLPKLCSYFGRNMSTIYQTGSFIGKWIRILPLLYPF